MAKVWQTNKVRGSLRLVCRYVVVKMKTAVQLVGSQYSKLLSGHLQCSDRLLGVSAATANYVDFFSFVLHSNYSSSASVFGLPLCALYCSDLEVSQLDEAKD